MHEAIAGDAAWNGTIGGIQASWRYLNYSERWHARGDHFAGIRYRIRAMLAYNNARFLQRYSLSESRSRECEPHLAALASALEVDDGHARPTPADTPTEPSLTLSSQPL